MGDGFVDLEDVERLFFRDEIVDADDDFFFFVDGHLIGVGGFGNFALRVTLFDGRDHAAHGVDSMDIVPCRFLDFVGEGFDEVRAAKRIDGIGYARFVSDDLLGAQSDGGGEFGGERPGFVERIGVERLRATENGSQSLNGGANDVVHGLLGGERAARSLRVETQGPDSADWRICSARSWLCTRCGARRGTWRSPRRNRCGR